MEEQYSAWLTSLSNEDLEVLLLRKEGDFRRFFPADAEEERRTWLTTFSGETDLGSRALFRNRRDPEVVAALLSALNAAKPPLTKWAAAVDVVGLAEGAALFAKRLENLLREQRSFEEPGNRREAARLAETLLEFRLEERLALGVLQKLVDPPDYSAAWTLYNVVTRRPDRDAPEAGSWLDHLRESQDDEAFAIAWGMTSWRAEESEWQRIERLVRDVNPDMRAAAIGALILGPHDDSSRAHALWSTALQTEPDRDFRFAVTTDVHDRLPVSFVERAFSEQLASERPDERFVAVDSLARLPSQMGAGFASAALDDEPDPYLRVLLRHVMNRAK